MRVAKRTTSPVPLYFKVMMEFRDEILSGKWSYGRRLPGEIELARRLGLPKSSIANICVALADAGLIRRIGTGFSLGRKLAELGPTEREVVTELSRTLMNKFLHDPTVRLRAAAANGRGLGVVDTARYLFGLERAGGAGTAPAADPEDTSHNE